MGAGNLAHPFYQQSKEHLKSRNSRSQAIFKANGNNMKGTV